MGKRKPMFYNALLLTAVNLLLRFISTSFQVYLSGKIGSEGIGLLQLVLSVGTLAMTAGMGGIRTATMYLCAEAIGQKRKHNIIWILSGCIMYSVVLSVSVGFLLYRFAPMIASVWIGSSSSVNAVRILAFFLPINCLCAVLVGCYTGLNRVGTLAAVEIAEQLITMVITVALLSIWAGHSTEKACQAVIMGSGLGGSFTLIVLTLLKVKEKAKEARRISIKKKLWETAVPLAIADNIKAGISTTENLMVPKRLSLFPGETSPLAAFGMVCGMVFPVLMFPASILFGLTELLIPEMARCRAAKSEERIKHLTERSMLLALLYGCLWGGIFQLRAESLCINLYKTPAAGYYLQRFGMLTPMLYCDAITDAITKGLGQQKLCVRYNIITSALDVVLLFLLLPKYGMEGYYVSFLLTHMINFLLSTRLLRILTGKIMPLRTVLLTLAITIISILVASQSGRLLQIPVFLTGFSALAILFGIVNRKDFKWLVGLIQR